MTPRFFLSAILFGLAGAPAFGAELCPLWGEPAMLGALDTAAIPEASGLEFSPAHPERLYHNNDSGDGPHLYVTGPDGGAARKITIDGFSPRDAEDLTAGPCGEAACLFLADIGDNAMRRRNVQIAVIAAPDGDLPERVAPRAVITATYPDGAHNAESAAMHPDGGLYVLTKTENGEPARLYRLTAAQLAAGGAQAFAYVNDIPLAAMLGEPAPKATAMDIAPDGTRAMILTYSAALEIAADFSAPFDPEAWREGADWRRIDTQALPQAEAIAYAADGRSILYNSEARPGAGAPMLRQDCIE